MSVGGIWNAFSAWVHLCQWPTQAVYGSWLPWYAAGMGYLFYPAAIALPVAMGAMNTALMCAFASDSVGSSPHSQHNWKVYAGVAAVTFPASAFTGMWMVPVFMAFVGLTLPIGIVAGIAHASAIAMGLVEDPKTKKKRCSKMRRPAKGSHSQQKPAKAKDSDAEQEEDGLGNEAAATPDEGAIKDFETEEVEDGFIKITS
eukprot:Clim_evm31s7 gene=Clim_evmTU31s7